MAYVSSVPREAGRQARRTNRVSYGMVWYSFALLSCFRWNKDINIYFFFSKQILHIVFPFLSFSFFLFSVTLRVSDRSPVLTRETFSRPSWSASTCMLMCY